MDIYSLADDGTEVTQAIPAGTPSLIVEILIKMEIIDHHIDQEDRFVGGKRPRKEAWVGVSSYVYPSLGRTTDLHSPAAYNYGGGGHIPRSKFLIPHSKVLVLSNR